MILAVVVCLGLLYTDDGVVGSGGPEWLQGALNVLIGLLRRYRLVANFAKSKAMTCQRRWWDNGARSVGEVTASI